VTNAGDGALKDDSPCCQELRDHCLSSAFNKSGTVLQDLINEFGRRFDYKVTNGRYQGTSKQIGFDGIWVSTEGQTVVAEVKTTDVYQISLDTNRRLQGEAS
jgi:hypothetical protein